MKTIGQRVRWIKYTLLISLFSMTGVDAWLFYSLSMSKKPDSLLIAMTFIVLGLCLVLFVFTSLNFIKKHDAILIQDDKVITREYKERTIPFKDIMNIQYRTSSSGGNRKGIVIGAYRSGSIVFTLKNNHKIIVTDIADVKEVCHQLRMIVLKTE